MALIYETGNFVVTAPDQPLIDRADGGHIVIDPKIKIRTRQELLPMQAIELMRLTLVAGQAFERVMNNHGVDVGRINYQDNGNWGVLKPEGPFMHIHLYGRAKSASIQPYGQTLYFPHREENPDFYINLKPITTTDISAIQQEIIRLFNLPQYSDETWGLIKE